MNFFLKLFGGESFKRDILSEVKRQQEIEVVALLEDTDVEIDALEDKVELLVEAHKELAENFRRHCEVWGGSTIDSVYEVVGTVAKKHDSKILQNLGGEIDALQDQIFAIQEQLSEEQPESLYEELSQASYPWGQLSQRAWDDLYKDLFLVKLSSLLAEEDNTWETFRERLIDEGLYDAPTFWYQVRTDAPLYAICPEDKFNVVGGVTMTHRDYLLKLAWERGLYKMYDEDTEGVNFSSMEERGYMPTAANKDRVVQKLVRIFGHYVLLGLKTGVDSNGNQEYEYSWSAAPNAHWTDYKKMLNDYASPYAWYVMYPDMDGGQYFKVPDSFDEPGGLNLEYRDQFIERAWNEVHDIDE